LACSQEKGLTRFCEGLFFNMKRVNIQELKFLSGNEANLNFAKEVQPVSNCCGKAAILA
jgi:hypothetical protein